MLQARQDTVANILANTTVAASPDYCPKLLLVCKRPVALHLWLWGFEPLALKQRDWIWVCGLVIRCLCLKMNYLLTWLAIYLFINKHW